MPQPSGELRSWNEVWQQPFDAACGIHNQPLDFACISCEMSKCIICSEECKRLCHEVYDAGQKTFENYVKKLLDDIFVKERELLQQSEVLKKPKSVLQDVKAARECHLIEINNRKRCIVDAVERVYEEVKNTMKNAYDKLEAAGNAADTDADRISFNLVNIGSCIHSLEALNYNGGILSVLDVVQKQMSLLSTKLDDLEEKLARSFGVLTLETSVQDNWENAIQSWIGVPFVKSASPELIRSELQQLLSRRQIQPQHRFSFGAATAIVNLPADCWGVSMSADGQLLLAAWDHGMMEFNSSSEIELSRWLPGKQFMNNDDCVIAVAALSKDHAAVALHKSRCIVILQKIVKKDVFSSRDTSDKSSDKAEWIVKRRSIQLPWSPCCLSADGDVLAVSEAGRRLLLLSSSSGRQLCLELHREYAIRSLAVSSRVIVTVSWGQVNLSNGSRAVQVIDAHSRAYGDDRLWRYELSHSCSKDDAELWGVCTDYTGVYLFAAVWRSDQSGSWLSALSLASGLELRRITLTVDSAAAELLLLPTCLSLTTTSSGRMVNLAALCLDPKTRNRRIVTVYQSAVDQQDCDAKHLAPVCEKITETMGRTIADCEKSLSTSESSSAVTQTELQTASSASNFSISKLMPILTKEMSVYSRTLKGFAYNFGQDGHITAYFSCESSEDLQRKTAELENILKKYIPDGLLKLNVVNSMPKSVHCCWGVGSAVTVGGAQQHIGLYLTYEGSDSIYWLSSAHGYLQELRSNRPVARGQDHFAEDHERTVIPVIRSKNSTALPGVDVHIVYFAYTHNGVPVRQNCNIVPVSEKSPMVTSSNVDQLTMFHSVDVLLGPTPLTMPNLNQDISYKERLTSAVTDNSLMQLRGYDAARPRQLYRISELRRFSFNEVENTVLLDMGDLWDKNLCCYLGDTGVMAKGKVVSVHYTGPMSLPGSDDVFIAQNMVLIRPTDKSCQAAKGHSGSVWVIEAKDRCSYEAVAVTSAITVQPDDPAVVMWLAAPLSACLLAISEEYPQRFPDWTKFNVLK